MSYKVYSSKYFEMEPLDVNPELIWLDEQMQNGYGYMHNSNLKKAIEIWQNLLEDVIQEMKKRKLSKFKELDEIFQGNQFISNWIWDFDEALEMQLLKKEDCDFYGKLRLKINDIMMEHETDSSLDNENIRRNIAETYFMMGKPHKGEELFKKYLEDDPDWGFAYIGWFDMIWREAKERDCAKAEKLLLEALENKNLRDRDVVWERLLSLYKECDEKQKYEEVQKRVEADKENARKNAKDNMVKIQNLEREFEKNTKKLINNFLKYKPGRNDPCPCGSGKKYKKCCGKN